eukprot:1138162-Pelagomonas_calceolata.AAC.1
MMKENMKRALTIALMQAPCALARLLARLLARQQRRKTLIVGLMQPLCRHLAGAFHACKAACTAAKKKTPIAALMQPPCRCLSCLQGCLHGSKAAHITDHEYDHEASQITHN